MSQENGNIKTPLDPESDGVCCKAAMVKSK